MEREGSLKKALKRLPTCGSSLLPQANEAMVNIAFQSNSICYKTVFVSIWSVVVAQLEERLLPTSEDPGSNTNFIKNIYPNTANF